MFIGTRGPDPVIPEGLRLGISACPRHTNQFIHWLRLALEEGLFLGV